MAASARNLLLGLILIVLAAAGCGNSTESEPPPQPAPVRKKVATPEKQTSQAVKPKERVARVEPPLPEKKPMIQQPEPSPGLPAEQVGKQLTYFYDPKGKPDPFQPLFATEVQLPPAKKKKGKEKKRPPLTPLQRIDLSQLKLVGIIVSPTGNNALVEEPSGKGYVIAKGTYLGTNFGRVKQILNDRVIVEEEVEDFTSGEMKPQTRELRLQKRPGQV
jgi:type IV pilus assembly protein PilP